jgi:hypothetical protein
MWDPERMKGLVGKGKVGRRDFIQLALAAGLSVAAAESMFAAAA